MSTNIHCLVMRSFTEPKAWKAALGLEQKFLFGTWHGIFTKGLVLGLILTVVST